MENLKVGDRIEVVVNPEFPDYNIDLIGKHGTVVEDFNPESGILVVKLDIHIDMYDEHGNDYLNGFELPSIKVI